MHEKSPKSGKYVFGVVKIGEKGQIVIPKDARDVFDLKTGDSLVVFGDTKKGGLALTKSEKLVQFANKLFQEEENK